MTHPYHKYEGTSLWCAVDEELRALENNGDLELTTAREYVVGALCERLYRGSLTSTDALMAVGIEKRGKCTGPG